MNIPFNKPYFTGGELENINKTIVDRHISGNGFFTKKCQEYFQSRYGIKKALLTTSCTDALEMCAILANINSGDEVIVPSYTFVSTAIAFVRQGAKIVFVDSSEEHPCMDVNKIESLITKKTKAIVPVHYGGVACDMDVIMMIAKKYNLIVIEDAAQSIDSFYKGRPLGSIGHLAAFSFHETKNIVSGEGGLLAVNDETYIKRSEIIWEKGTNRAEFYRGEVNKYGWVDTGSSFLPSEIIAAFLWAQLENLETIQKKRVQTWLRYKELFDSLLPINGYKCNQVPGYSSVNGHIFFLVCPNEMRRNMLISHLRKLGISAVFHYLSLHNSVYFKNKYNGDDLFYSDLYSNNLLRLPLYFELTELEIDYVFHAIREFIVSDNINADYNG